MVSGETFRGLQITTGMAPQAAPVWTANALKFWQDDSSLRLVLSFTIGVAGFANFVRLEENNLAKAFVGVDPRRKRRGVGDFEGDESFPFGLERGHIYDNSATRISALTHADGQHAAGNSEVFDRAGQGKGIRRHYADIGLHSHKRLLVETLGIDQRVIHIGED